MERWLSIPGYEGHYDVSDHGRVRSLKTNRILKQQNNRREGRPQVCLSKDGVSRTTTPYVLVLKAFVGPKPEGYQCCHWDGDAFNNHLSNLRWGTPAENQADKIRHGTTSRGEKSSQAALTQAKVDAIRADTRLHRVIAADFGINESTVTRIKNFTRWPVGPLSQSTLRSSR